jgi:hypothetical protein
LAGPKGSRFLDLTKLFDDHHPHRSYWYLQFMGVTPGWQGQGIGSALMAPMLERCNREGVRAYLDATSERNKRLYERHGFQAKDPFAAPGGPPVWPMWRQPASDRLRCAEQRSAGCLSHRHLDQAAAAVLADAERSIPCPTDLDRIRAAVRSLSSMINFRSELRPTAAT